MFALFNEEFFFDAIHTDAAICDFVGRLTAAFTSAVVQVVSHVSTFCNHSLMVYRDYTLPPSVINMASPLTASSAALMERSAE